MTFVVSERAGLGLSIVCFDVPPHLQTEILSDLKKLAVEKQKAMIQDPCLALSLILHPLLHAYDRSVWMIRDHVCAWEAVSHMLSS